MKKTLNIQINKGNTCIKIEIINNKRKIKRNNINKREYLMTIFLLSR